MSTDNPVHDFIGKTIAENQVVLFMKGVPDRPQCGFSALVVQVLDHMGVDYVGVDVLQDQDLREGIKSFSDWPTIPQLYVKGGFIGGAVRTARGPASLSAELRADAGRDRRQRPRQQRRLPVLGSGSRDVPLGGPPAP